MYIHVKLLNGFKEPLWYKAPATNDASNLVGSIVQVPLRTHIIPACVIAQQQGKPSINGTIRQAHTIEHFPTDAYYWHFIQALAAYYCIEPLYFLKRIKQFLSTEKEQVELLENTVHTTQRCTLTQEQQHAYETIKPFIIQTEYVPFVLHGVTGSGKTEVYKALILDAYAQHKTTILLLPEVTLAVAFEHRLKKELDQTIHFFSFHSGTSAAEKRALWQHLVQGTPLVIIGVHLPILLPIANLGLIIVDEEHEIGYQEKKHPKINTKHAAILRASINAIPIVLGSATPSMSSLYQVKTKQWRFLQLKQRFAGCFPTIQTVYLSDKKQRKHFWISTQLYNAIKNRLEKKEQTLLFLNRRGHSFFVQCSVCSFIFMCNHCSVSLTLHEGDLLRCHYCQYKCQLPNVCTSCNASEKTFIKKGIGTQQVVSIIQRLFPQARVARADLDTTIKRKKWQHTMSDFAQGGIDILVGTQTITKGYDFPHVTLVGIIWADLNLNFPTFNASETALQQLIQVAGRAGRHHKSSDVIVQAMGHHSIFDFLNELDYLKFYAHAMGSRKELGYPPVKKLALLELKHAQELVVEKEAHALVYHLQTIRNKQAYDVRILGPAQPPIHKIERIFSRCIYLKAPTIQDIHALYKVINHGHYKSSIFFTPAAQ